MRVDISEIRDRYPSSNKPIRGHPNLDLNDFTFELQQEEEQ